MRQVKMTPCQKFPMYFTHPFVVKREENGSDLPSQFHRVVRANILNELQTVIEPREKQRSILKWNMLLLVWHCPGVCLRRLSLLGRLASGKQLLVGLANGKPNRRQQMPDQTEVSPKTCRILPGVMFIGWNLVVEPLLKPKRRLNMRSRNICFFVYRKCGPRIGVSHCVLVCFHLTIKFQGSSLFAALGGPPDCQEDHLQYPWF